MGSDDNPDRNLITAKALGLEVPSAIRGFARASMRTGSLVI
jgi:hypothetical protein